MKQDNDSLRAALQMQPSIGGMRIGHDLLNQQQINRYLLERIIDLERNECQTIRALQSLGVDRCDECKEWNPNAKIVLIGDRCQCERCFCWEYFIREDDDDATIAEYLPQLMRRIRYTPLEKQLPHDSNGVLEEPFLSEYRKQTRNA